MSMSILQQRLFETNVNEQTQSRIQADQDTWQYHYHKIISGLDGTQEEKQATIRKRILRYFGEFKLDSETYLSIRSDVDYAIPNVQVFQNKLILFGVDFMSLEKCRNYFQGFLTSVRRIDDSHFMVEFRNQSQCLSAINKKNKAQKMLFNSQDLFKFSNKGWIEMKPYYEFIFQRKLMARFATNLDRFDNISNVTKQSCIFAYSEAKRRFMKTLREDVQSHDRRRDRHSRDRKDSYQTSKSRGKSLQRSREKLRISSKTIDTESLSPQPKHRRIEQCRCEHSRKFSRSRSRSRSEDEHDKKVEQEQKIRESNFKFNLYLRRRNDNKGSSKKSQIVQNNQPNIENKSRQNMSQIFKQGSMDLEAFPFPRNMLQENEELDTSGAPDFTRFLENLKLSDSKAQYSAFELEDIE